MINDFQDLLFLSILTSFSSLSMTLFTNLWQTLPLLLLLFSHAFADDFNSIVPQLIQEDSAAATIDFPDTVNSDLRPSDWATGGGDSPEFFFAGEKVVNCGNSDTNQIQTPIKERRPRLRKRAEDEFCSWQKPQSTPSSVQAPTQETEGTGAAGSTTREGGTKTQQPDGAAPQQRITVPSERSRLDTDLLSNSPCRSAGSIRPIGLASMVDLQVPVCHLFGDVPGSGLGLESWLPICRSCKLVPSPQSVNRFHSSAWRAVVFPPLLCSLSG